MNAWRCQQRRPFPRRISEREAGDPPILALCARDLSSDGIAVEPSPELVRAGRVHVLLESEGPGESLLVWARLVRSDDVSTALRFEPAEDVALRRRLATFVEGLERRPSVLAETHAPA